ncbi:hypothetical protein N7495_009721 [Penicillium taxi]|uniref:uncharacterized protein n=1 Tax=Penicillium taxi TaxID=168475 RepID=UPI00254581E3|nr:uncharacterized protein N7495_009721 [Penicillium taxi]KAJ5885211.1 hypothetical protein N7495_009721 [Penicillium taxi]
MCDGPSAFAELKTDILVLCPNLWKEVPSQLCEKDWVMPEGSAIDSRRTIGSVIFHELTHLILGRCLELAQTDPQKAQNNAQSFMYFAIGMEVPMPILEVKRIKRLANSATAMLYKGNAWYNGKAQAAH